LQNTVAVFFRLDSNHSTHGIDTTLAVMSLSASNFWAATANCNSDPVPIRTTSGSSFGVPPST
jgi:hypothetical protein